MEIELRIYSQEKDKWSKSLDNMLNAGFEGLTSKLQHSYEAWLTHGQVRQLIFDMKTQKQVSKQGKITPARLKSSCVGITLKIQPADLSVQVMIQIGKEDWREIRCYYCGQKDLPGFADIQANQFHHSETEDIEEKGSEHEDMEEMEFADLMHPESGSDYGDNGSELFELYINEMIKIHSDAKKDIDKIGISLGKHFKGLCMFILRLGSYVVSKNCF